MAKTRIGWIFAVLAAAGLPSIPAVARDRLSSGSAVQWETTFSGGVTVLRGSQGPVDGRGLNTYGPPLPEDGTIAGNYSSAVSAGNGRIGAEVTEYPFEFLGGDSLWYVDKRSGQITACYFQGSSPRRVVCTNAY